MRTTARGAYAVLALTLAVPLAGLAALGPVQERAQRQAQGQRPVQVPRQVQPAVPPSPTPLAVSPQPVRPAPVRVVEQGDGRPVVVPGTSATRGSGPLQRYTVEVEGGLGVDPKGFAAAVERTLGDARSWGAGGRLSFRRVDRGPVAFRVVLASPGTTDVLCAPLDTAGVYSCANGGRAVINAGRWLRGARSYGGDLSGYRAYVVNHEVGHTLGHGHERCPGPGQVAPVMLQQTKGLDGCAKNPWPHPGGNRGEAGTLEDGDMHARR